MKSINFQWDGDGELLAFLSRKSSRISVKSIGVSTPVSLTLWSEKSGFRVYSKIYESDDRQDIGYLAFKVVSDPLEGEIFFENEIIPNRFDIIKKLKIKTDKALVECGLEIRMSSRSVFIIAGAMPFSIAVSGLEKMGFQFDPAYPLSDYLKVDLRE